MLTALTRTESHFAKGPQDVAHGNREATSNGRAVERRRSGPGARPRRSSFVMTGAGLPHARGQDTLRWKFRDGDVLKYTTEQTTVMTVKVMGKERKQKRAVTTTYTWSIKAFPRPATPTSRSESND